MFTKEKILKAWRIIFTICGGWWGLMSGPPSIPLFVLGLYLFQGHDKVWFWTGAFICLWIFAIRMVWINYHLKLGDSSSLKIEFVPTDKFAASRHPFYIRIRNKSQNRNADDLKVEVISFKDDLSEQFESIAKRYYHPTHFDKVAELKSATGRNTINPGDGLEFIVFYFEPSVKIQGRPRSVVATFDLKEAYGKENAASFHEGKEYRIIFAASARGDGMSRVEQEFRFSFSTNGNICQISAAPVVELTKAEKIERLKRANQIKDELTKIGTLFVNCISSLKGMDPSGYKEEKEDAHIKANDAAVAYILFNLNQDAQKAYDEGIDEIQPWTVRKSGEGSTRYEDDYNTVLQRAHRRFLNLIHIADNVDKYLK